MSANCAYHPLRVGAGETKSFDASRICGFLADTDGTITIVRNDGFGNTTTLIDAMAVSDGVFVDIPMFIGIYGGSITTASATGILFVS